MKKIALLSLLSLWLLARENPFFLPREQVAPVAPPQEQPITAKQPQQPLHPKVPRTPAPNPQPPQTIAHVPSHEENATRQAAAKQSGDGNVTQTQTFNFSKVITLPFVKISFASDAFLVQTKDPMKRKFLLDTPRKFVIDYAARRSFGYKRYPIGVGNFTQLELASHPGYYRIAISLQGCKNYDFSSSEEGFLFRCK